MLQSLSVRGQLLSSKLLNSSVVSACTMRGKSISHVSHQTMPTVDWESVKKSKDDYRARVRARSFQEKLCTLERLREREAQLRKLRTKKNLSTSVRSTLVISSGGDRASNLVGNSNLVVLGADATYVASIVARGSVSMSVSRTVPSSQEAKAP